MNGVTILNQFEVVTQTAFNSESFWYGGLLGAILGLILAIVFGAEQRKWSAFFLGFIVYCTILGLFIGLLSGFVLVPKPVEYETHYEVSINEEVSMQEFMYKYEIIETRGSIYTVREKYE